MSKNCILVILYKRPDYTRQLLAALSAQPTIKNYHVHFQIDPGFPEVENIARDFVATEKTILVNQFRLDCNMNVYAGLKNAFAISEFVMVFEDDCIPAHDCLEWMEWAKTQMGWDARAINAFHRHEEKDESMFNMSKRCAHWTAWVWGTSREHWKKIEEIFQDKDKMPEDSSNSWDCVLFEQYFKHGTVIKPYLSRARNIGSENGRYNPSAEWHKENMWIDQWSDSVDRSLLDRENYSLDRTYQRDLRCFCGGYYDYAPFNRYLVCRDCGTYHSPTHAEPKEYYDQKYWSADKGNSTPIEQWYNLTSSWFKGIKPRVDFWMDMIGNIEPGTSFEIGCFPGVLMQRMMNCGWDVYGLDADPWIATQAQDLSKIPKDKFAVGLWPSAAEHLGITDADMIVCTDVYEHTPDPRAFITVIHACLAEGGYAFIQTPVVLGGRDLSQPFGELTDNIFEPNQHIYLYSEKGFMHLIKDLFSVVDVRVWHEGHECFLLKKK